MALRKSVEQYEADIINDTHQKYEEAALQLEQKKFHEEITVEEYKSRMRILRFQKKYSLFNAYQEAHRRAGIRFFDDEFY